MDKFQLLMVAFLRWNKIDWSPTHANCLPQNKHTHTHTSLNKQTEAQYRKLISQFKHRISSKLMKLKIQVKKKEGNEMPSKTSSPIVAKEIFLRKCFVGFSGEFWGTANGCASLYMCSCACVCACVLECACVWDCAYDTKDLMKISVKIPFAKWPSSEWGRIIFHTNMIDIGWGS